jgi:hypothetical protein
VFTREASSHYFDMAQLNLSRALALLEEWRKSGDGWVVGQFEILGHI